MRGVCGDRRMAICSAAERFVESRRCALNETEQPVGRREVRIQLDRMVALLERGLEVAAAWIIATSRDDRGPDPAIAPSASRRALRPAGPAAQPEEARTNGARSHFGLRRMARWNSRSAPVQSQCCVAFTFASGVRFGGIIERDGHPRARGGLRPHLRRPPHAVMCEQSVRVGHAAVRQGVVGVLRQRALEEISARRKPSVR